MLPCDNNRARDDVERITNKPAQPKERALRDLIALFLRLGITAFGGPAAHIAMMRHEVVEQRRWMTDAAFLDLLAATNLIPGPNSTEMAIHIGYRRHGLLGLIAAGVCFILPACIIVGTIAWGYKHYGDTPQVIWLMYGVSPVIIAILIQAVWKLGHAAITDVTSAIVGTLAAAFSIAGFNELALLIGGGLTSFAVRLGGRIGAIGVVAALSASATLVAASTTTTAVPVTLTRLTLAFLKIGSILFGSGYVLLAFLRADLAERLGWLTEQQLIDAVTVGQVTPGPVFTTATFIGYLLEGWTGAAFATFAIFAPGFVLVAVTQPLIPRLRQSTIASALLDGVVAASLGLMVAVSWHLGRTAIADVPTLLLLGAAGVLLCWWKPNSTWLIVGGAGAGWLLRGVAPI